MIPRNMNELAEVIGSYPHLVISRKYNIPHGTVLCFADAYKKKFKDLNYWEKKATAEIQGSLAAQDIIYVANVMAEYVAANG